MCPRKKDGGDRDHPGELKKLVRSKLITLPFDKAESQQGSYFTRLLKQGLKIPNLPTTITCSI